MGMIDLSSVTLRKTSTSTQQKKAAPQPPAGGMMMMGMMGMGPGFNPAAVKLKKTNAGPMHAPQPPKEEQHGIVDFRANLRKTGTARAPVPAPIPAPAHENNGENGKFDFRANLRKTGFTNK